MGKVLNITVDGCWEPSGYRDARGRGRVRARDVIAASGVAIPLGAHVVRLCASKSCINPGHHRVQEGGERMDALRRFWLAVTKTEGCWEWDRKARGSWGYGRIWWNGRVRKAHHVSWEIHCGAITNGLWVLHHCDNPSCVRPDHLYLGTAADNARDMVGRGRSRAGPPPGEANPSAVLTEAIVRDIRRRVQAGEQYRAISRDIGVSETTVRSAALRETWRHVE